MNEQNIKETSKNSEVMGYNSFFSRDSISYIPQNGKKKLSVEEKRWQILSYIQKNPYSNIYEIAKGMDMAYSQIYQAIRELVFCRLILNKPKQNKTKTEMLESYYIPIRKEINKNEI